MLGTAPIGRLMLKLAVPAVAAQFINMLYNIVDRIYIGHIPEVGDLALTGVGVTFPIITLVSAFAAFAGQGGAPLAASSWGREKRTRRSGSWHSLALLLMTAAVLTGGLQRLQGAHPAGLRRLGTPPLAMPPATSASICWHGLRPAGPGPEHLHQCPGESDDRHAQRAHRRGH